MVDCQPIVDWLGVVPTMKVGNNKLPLALLHPTTPLADGDIFRHYHHMLIRNLPGLDPSLHRS